MDRKIVLALVLVVSTGPAGAARLTYSDQICEYAVTFDATKVDGTRLKATFDYLVDPVPPLELAPDVSTPEAIAAIDVAAYRARCAAHRVKLTGLRLLDLEALAALRDADVATLDATCARVEASLAAARGDVSPARALAPTCTRWTDLLALPEAKLKAQWNDLVVDLCATSTEPRLCAGQMQRSGEGPGSLARRRLAVLDRWNECATRPAPDTEGDKQRLRDRLARRFKARALSCAR